MLLLLLKFTVLRSFDVTYFGPKMLAKFIVSSQTLCTEFAHSFCFVIFFRFRLFMTNYICYCAGGKTVLNRGLACFIYMVISYNAVCLLFRISLLLIYLCCVRQVLSGDDFTEAGKAECHC